MNESCAIIIHRALDAAHPTVKHGYANAATCPICERDAERLRRADQTPAPPLKTLRPASVPAQAALELCV